MAESEDEKEDGEKKQGINDPLTGSDVEAPRKSFPEGSPESGGDES